MPGIKHCITLYSHFNGLERPVVVKSVVPIHALCGVRQTIGIVKAIQVADIAIIVPRK